MSMVVQYMCKQVYMMYNMRQKHHQLYLLGT